MKNSQKGSTKLIVIGLALFIIVLLGSVWFMGIGVHSCYVDNSFSNQKCHKGFSTAFSDSHFDPESGTYKIKKLKFFGIYQDKCITLLPFSGCSTSVSPWIVLNEGWVVGSRKCDISKVGTIQSDGTPKIAGNDYETYEGKQTLIRYQVVCGYIEDTYGRTADEFVDKQILLKYGYALPNNFTEKISVTPKE